MSQRPTTLKLMLNHCPHAITLYEQGAPQDRRVFAVGKIAHEVLDLLYRERPEDPAAAAERLVERLVADGTPGHDAEPPVLPDANIEGMALALGYYDKHREVEPGALNEHGLAVREDWTPGEYGGPSAYYGARLDRVFTVEVDDEDSYGTGLVVRDYKSAWNAGQDDVDSVQMRSQAVLAWIHRDRLFPGVAFDFVRREIANLRTGAIYSGETWVEDEPDTLASWQRQIDMLIRAASRVPRRASPGAGCVSCPYAGVCFPARDYLSDLTPGVGPMPAPERVATAYAIAEGLRSYYAGVARDAVKALGRPIPVAGGLVGYNGKVKSKPRDEAVSALVRAWTEGQEVDAPTVELMTGLLDAVGLSKRSIEGVGKVLYPERTQAAERRAWVETMVEQYTSAEFGVQRTKEGTR